MREKGGVLFEVDFSELELKVLKEWEEMVATALKVPVEYVKGCKGNMEWELDVKKWKEVKGKVEEFSPEGVEVWKVGKGKDRWIEVRMYWGGGEKEGMDTEEWRQGVRNIISEEYPGEVVLFERLKGKGLSKGVGKYLEVMEKLVEMKKVKGPPVFVATQKPGGQNPCAEQKLWDTPIAKSALGIFDSWADYPDVMSTMKLYEGEVPPLKMELMKEKLPLLKYWVGPPPKPKPLFFVDPTGPWDEKWQVETGVEAVQAKQEEEDKAFLKSLMQMSPPGKSRNVKFPKKGR